MSPPRRRDRLALVRPYLITEGRTRPVHDALDLTTLVHTADGGDADDAVSPEGHRAVRLCSGGALSVAEVAAHLELPPSVTKVLVADLVDSGHLSMRTPAQAPGPNRELLQEVLDGLRSL